MTTHGSAYRVPFRRRLECKTDYYQRRELIRSRKVRLIIRSSLSHTTVQFAKAEKSGDIILASASSQEISKKYGWKASTGNLPAAYLTGFLAGLKARSEKLGEAMLDAGIKRPSPGSKIYASLKGVIDAGVSVPVEKDVFPADSKIRGEHIVDYFGKIADPLERERKFSLYFKKGLSIESLPTHFDEVKMSIEKSYSQ